MPPDTTESSFASHFWGDDKGKDVLYERLRQGKETCEQLKAFMIARAEIEHSYGEQLLKLSKLQLGGDELASSFRDSLQLIQASVLKSGEAHLNFAEKLRNELYEPLCKQLEEQKETRKGHQSSLENTFQLKQLYQANALEAKKAYHVECEKLKKWKALQTASIGTDVESIEEAIDASLLSVLAADREMKRACDIHSEFTEKWNVEWEKACVVFESMEVKRLELMRECMWEYSNIVSSTCVLEDEVAEAARVMLETCDIKEELTTFMSKKGTGAEKPKPIPYAPIDLSEYNFKNRRISPLMFTTGGQAASTIVNNDASTNISSSQPTSSRASTLAVEGDSEADFTRAVNDVQTILDSLMLEKKPSIDAKFHDEGDQQTYSTSPKDDGAFLASALRTTSPISSPISSSPPATATPSSIVPSPVPSSLSPSAAKTSPVGTETRSTQKMERRRVEKEEINEDFEDDLPNSRPISASNIASSPSPPSHFNRPVQANADYKGKPVDPDESHKEEMNVSNSERPSSVTWGTVSPSKPATSSVHGNPPLTFSPLASTSSVPQGFSSASTHVQQFHSRPTPYRPLNSPSSVSTRPPFGNTTDAEPNLNDSPHASSSQRPFSQQFISVKNPTSTATDESKNIMLRYPPPDSRWPSRPPPSDRNQIGSGGHKRVTSETYMPGSSGAPGPIGGFVHSSHNRPPAPQLSQVAAGAPAGRVGPKGETGWQRMSQPMPAQGPLSQFGSPHNQQARPPQRPQGQRMSPSVGLSHLQKMPEASPMRVGAGNIAPQPQTNITPDGRTILEYVQSLWSYTAAIPEEISFSRGDTLAVLHKLPDGWWEGEVVSPTKGKRGLFPSNYVKPL
ncbi:uncharacterized protein VTP21DRAFT_7735 [Calcarisporiella thermophila]|uniref:uncharacterized protein n=1 Tax=Calcarisporiella thermophila TaxID=911321 RepID=UPI0037444E12